MGWGREEVVEETIPCCRAGRSCQTRLGWCSTLGLQRIAWAGLDLHFVDRCVWLPLSASQAHGLSSNELLGYVAPAQAASLLLLGPAVDKLVTSDWVWSYPWNIQVITGAHKSWWFWV